MALDFHPLKVVRVTVPKENAVVGIRAALMVDDVNGNVLVIQSEVNQLRIKLTDLVDFITHQEAPEYGEAVNVRKNIEKEES